MKTAIKVTLGTMLVASLAATAAQANPWNRMAVTGTVTYTEASNNGASFGDLPTTAGGGEGGRRAFFIEPETQFDYGLGLSYRMGGSNPSPDTRLYLDYDHFRDSKDRQAAGLRNLGFAAAGANDANGDLRHRAHQFRAGVTQTLHFGPKLDVALNGFVDYTKLERKMEEVIRQAANVRARSTENELRGFGPGFGAMARGTPLNTCPEFGVFGGMNATLLYSDEEFAQSAFESVGGAPVNVIYQFNPEDSRSIVAKLDAELGVDYRRVINSDMARVLFHAALGVRYMNAVNAFKNGNTAWNPNDATGANNFARWTGPAQDFGRMGPFLRFTLGGADA